ncbi:MAG TPA: hypothetical protein VGJ97_10705 [Anaerolineaceae bacterium]
MKKALPILIVVLLIGLLALPMTVFAHQTVTVGDYAVEYGWVNEPAVAGQPNAVVINVTSPNSPDAAIDVSGLKVQAVYGGQDKLLALQPLGENTPGQYIAPITPTRPGKYTIHLGGSIGATAFNTDVQPEEVQTADVVQFPVTAGELANSNTSAPLPAWLPIAGILFGVVGTILGILALARKTVRS